MFVISFSRFRAGCVLSWGVWIIKYLICDMLKNFIKKPGGTSFAQKHLENICNSDEKADTWLQTFAKLILGANLKN